MHFCCRCPEPSRSFVDRILSCDACLAIELSFESFQRLQKMNESDCNEKTKKCVKATLHCQTVVGMDKLTNLVSRDASNEGSPSTETSSEQELLRFSRCDCEKSEKTLKCRKNDVRVVVGTTTLIPGGSIP